jgi:hypothetical protein
MQTRSASIEGKSSSKGSWSRSTSGPFPHVDRNTPSDEPIGDIKNDHGVRVIADFVSD